MIPRERLVEKISLQMEKIYMPYGDKIWQSGTNRQKNFIYILEQCQVFLQKDCMEEMHGQMEKTHLLPLVWIMGQFINSTPTLWRLVQ